MKGAAGGKSHEKKRKEDVWVTLDGGSCQPVAFTIPCLFWREDGVWVGVAKSLEVAACGHGFREARFNLREAIESHFESAIELWRKEASQDGT